MKPLRHIIITVVVIAVFLELSGLIWSAKQSEPSELYRRLSRPPDTSLDPKTNGYFMMIGFGASATADPVQTGFDMWREIEAERGSYLFNYGKPGRSESRTMLEAGEAFPAWLSPTPLASIRQPDALLRLSMDRYKTLLSRYERFLAMPFEDWGFGYRAVPRFDEFAVVHRLYIAAGHAESSRLGWARLQQDMQLWRRLLANARTASVKTAALLMLDDDLAFLTKALREDAAAPTATLLSATRPLMKDDYSLRWPIQNELVIGSSRGRDSGLRLITERDETVRNQEWLARKAGLAPEAFQRVQHPPFVTFFETTVESRGMWDTYAIYYEAAITASETVHSPLPKLSDVAPASRRTLVETMLSPLDFEPDWDAFSLRLMETDARLRLASLQLLLRRTSSAAASPDRLAEAGPRYFDPFTGLPMLWNDQQSMVYSVGRDRVDDGGDPHFDVVVPLALERGVSGTGLKDAVRDRHKPCHRSKACGSMPLA
jgi:hypothetical protein